MLYWIWLTCLQGIGPVTQHLLIDKFGEPEVVYNSSLDELVAVAGIGSAPAQNIIQQRKAALVKAQDILDTSYRHKIKILQFNSSIFPENIKRINRMPVVLYYKGQILNPCSGVAIVGARRCTEYGKSVSAEAATYLAKVKIPVISGMAKGIDSYAHTACIKSGGYTIAFLANGIDICYPQEHKELMNSIIDTGAVISPFPPGIRAETHNFPIRNALMSAWVSKVLVVEAGERSGALLTADFAMKYGKSVYSVPDSIYSGESKGCNKLIHDGAVIYLDPSQLAEGFKVDDCFTKITTKKHNENCFTDYLADPLQRKIVAVLKAHKELNLEQIAVSVNSSLLDIIESISLLELDGFISGLPGQRYRIR